MSHGSHHGGVDPQNLPTSYQDAGSQVQQAQAQAWQQAMQQAANSPNPLAVITAIVDGAAHAQQGKANANAAITNQEQTLAQNVDTRPAPNVAGGNYMSYSHDALYQMVNNDMSAGQVGDSSQAWNKISNSMLTISKTLNNAATSTESSWTGAAADSARSFHTGVASWTGTTSESAQLVSDNMYNQSQSAQAAQSSVPKPVPYSFTDELKDFFSAPNPVAGMSTVNQKLAAQQQAHQQAATAVQTYDSALGQSAGKMPAMAPVPTFSPSSGSGTTGGGPGGTGGGPGGGGGGGAPTFPGGNPGGGGGAGQGGGGGGGGFVSPPMQPGPGFPGGNPGGPGGPGGSGAIPVPPGTTTDPSWTMPGGGGPGSPGFPGGPGGVGGGPGGPGGPGGGFGMPMGGFGGPAFGGGPGGGGSGGGSGFGRTSGMGGAGGSGGFGGGRGGGGFGPGGSGTAGADAGTSAGARSAAGAAAAEEAAMGRGIAGARGAAGEPGAGGAGMGGGRGGRGKDDEEHKRPSFLVEADPDSIFGTDERTVPPVIGG